MYYFCVCVPHKIVNSFTNTISYNVEDQHKLPHNLQPSNLSKKENDQWLIFGGILIQYNCVSSFYKSKLIHNDTEFDTIKAAYQYTKATRFHDKACANNVILAQSPSKAKSLGSNVKGFKKYVWDSEKDDAILDLLRAKSSSISPLATSGNHWQNLIYINSIIVYHIHLHLTI